MNPTQAVGEIHCRSYVVVSIVMGVAQNRWFVMGNPHREMDDWVGTPILGKLQLVTIYNTRRVVIIQVEHDRGPSTELRLCCCNSI